MAGRPPKLTDETQQLICKLIRAGNTVEVAADAAQIGPTAFYEWMQKGLDKGREPYAGFREAVELARAEAEAMLVGAVRQAAGRGAWRAACWMLERQWPERWASLQEKDRAGGGTDLDRELDRILQHK